MTDLQIGASAFAAVVALLCFTLAAVEWIRHRRLETDRPKRDRPRLDVDARDLVLLLALGLIAGGFWQFWAPGAMLVPGLILLVLAVGRR
jgi:hypothetical protein